MKMKLMLVALLAFTVSCTEDKLKVIHNNDRVSDLEQRADLNDQINAEQNRLIGLNAAAIISLQERDTQLQAQIDALSTRMSNAEGDISDLEDELHLTQLAQLIIDGLQQIRINQLQTKVGQLTTQLSQLTTRVNNTENSIATLQGQMSTVQGQITALQQRDIQLQSAIDVLSARVTTAEGDIDDLYAKYNNLKGRVQSLEISQALQNIALLLMAHDMNQLRNRISSLEGDVASLDHRLDNLEDDMEDLQDQVNSLPTDAEVDAAIEDAVEDLQAQIDALELEIDALQANSGGSGGSGSGACSVTLYASYNGQKQYAFSVTGMSSYNNYELEVKMNASVSSVGDSNGGDDDLSSNGKTWTIEPQNNASSFNFYIYYSGSNKYVTEAKVTKGSTTINCTVPN